MDRPSNVRNQLALYLRESTNDPIPQKFTSKENIEDPGLFAIKDKTSGYNLTIQKIRNIDPEYKIQIAPRLRAIDDNTFWMSKKDIVSMAKLIANYSKQYFLIPISDPHD